jgi:hypothetical protein
MKDVNRLVSNLSYTQVVQSWSGRFFLTAYLVYSMEGIGIGTELCNPVFQSPCSLLNYTSYFRFKNYKSVQSKNHMCCLKTSQTSVTCQNRRSHDWAWEENRYKKDVVLQNVKISNSKDIKSKYCWKLRARIWRGQTDGRVESFQHQQPVTLNLDFIPSAWACLQFQMLSFFVRLLLNRIGNGYTRHFL